jgi:polyhydroxyalkanoate synthesis regulator phasin
MATLEEIMAARSSTSLATPQLAPLPKTKLQEKKERLFGAPAVPSYQAEKDEAEKNSFLSLINDGSYGGNTPDFGDRFESNLYKSGGSLADMGKSISNSLFGTEFDDSVETGWSRQANPETRQASAADEMAGISFDKRENANQEFQGVMDTYVEDGFLPALWDAVPLAGGAIADSSGSLVEVGAGAIATAAGGSGLAVLAKKAKNTYDLIGKISDSYDKAKEANRAVKAATKLASTVGKNASQASLLTADIVQQTKVEYEQETGEKMSPERLAGTTLITLATTAFQPEIVRRFFIPGSKSFAGKGVKEKFSNEMKQMSKYLDQGTAKAVANRIGAGAGKVFAAGGAEAVQEYAQTWAGILSVHMNPEEAGGFFASAYKEFSDDDNQNESEVAGILGSVAGGGIRAASAVPTTAVGAVADVAVGTGNAIAKKSYNAARDRLNPEDQAADIEERQNLRAAAQEIQTEAARKVGVVSEAKGFQDITDETVKAEFTRLAAGRDLSDPEVFKSVSNEAVRSYKADSTLAMADENIQAGFIKGKKIVRKVGDNFAKILDLTPEEVQKVKDYTIKKVEDTKSFGKAFSDDLKNFKSSATVGVAEAAVDFVSETTKETTKKGVDYANSKESVQKLKNRLEGINSVNAARTMADSLEKNSPDNSVNAVREIRSWADQKEKDQKRTNRKNDSYVNFESLGESVKEASQKGATVTNPRALSIELSEISKGTIENMETLQSVENAFENYKQTDFSKNGNSPMGPVTRKNLGRKLVRSRARLELEGDTSVTARAKSAADATVEAAGKATAWAKPAVDKLKSLGISTVDALVDRVTNEDVFISEDNEQQRGVISLIQGLVKKELNSKENPEVAKLSPEEQLNVKIARIFSENKEKGEGKEVFGDITIKGISKSFKTSNPDYIMAVMGRIFSPARTPAVEKILRARIAESLKDSKQPNTEPTRQRKKSTDDTVTKDKNSSDSTVDNDSNVVIEEDGAVFRSAPDLAAVNARLVEILGNNICKV